MFLWGRKDGGPESTVTAYGIEIKKLFSILFLRFECGSREAYHNHAFNSVSLVLTGALHEIYPDAGDEEHWWSDYGSYFWESGNLIYTGRDTVHKVFGLKPTNWVLSLRGPWNDDWYEIEDGKRIDLSIGRKVK